VPPPAEKTPRKQRKPDDPEALNEFLRAQFDLAAYQRLRKEEKRAYRIDLAAQLNERRFTEQRWTEADLLKKLTNLGFQLRAPTPAAMKENVSTADPRRRQSCWSSPTARQLSPAAAAVGASEDSALQAYFRRAEESLLAGYRTSKRFDHPTNRGTLNEVLVKKFLRLNLGSSRVGVGSGEVLSSTARRQLDVVVYDAAMPRLQPDDDSDIALFFEESVIAVVEVKTTLNNGELATIGEAAAALPAVPYLVLAFDSQVDLGHTNVDALPPNLLGIYSLRYGTIQRSADGWSRVGRHQPGADCPLLQLYHRLLLLSQAQYAASSEIPLERYK
jgi:hypothetical protein